MNARAARVQPITKTVIALAALAGVVIAVDDTPLMESARSQLWGLNSLHYAEFERRLAARQKLDFHVGMGPGKLQPEQVSPPISPAGGIFNGPLEVTVDRPDRESDIRCTFDGSIPTQHSSLYTSPLSVTTSTVVRCRAFRRGYQPSMTSTRTYVVNPAGALPILAVTLDPTNLNNKYTGIYARYSERGSEWERDAQVEYLPRANEKPLLIPGRMRIHGFYSRASPKKSLRFYYSAVAPEQYDDDNLLTWPTSGEERIVIFSARERLVSRDELFQHVYAAHGGHVANHRPVFLYLNAVPWGIYFMRERVDEDFLHRHIGPGEYDLLDGQPGRPDVIVGDRKHWDSMIEFFETADFKDDATIETVDTLMDLDNFTDYWLYNIYAANRDWPHHNMRMYRHRSGEDTRWRWISWDADGAFDFLGKGLDHNTLAWATRSTLRHDLRMNNEAGLRDNEGMLSSTLIARQLLRNPGYRERFVRRMRELLATELTPPMVMAEFDKLHEALAADMDADWTRWDMGEAGIDDDRLAYAEDRARVRTFIERRPAIVEQHLKELEQSD